jgi:predicted metalloprotease with PDZ domain
MIFALDKDQGFLGGKDVLMVNTGVSNDGSIFVFEVKQSNEWKLKSTLKMKADVGNSLPMYGT